MTKQDLSQIFTKYNGLKGQVEIGRLDRALGLVQSSKPDHGYQTTATSCTCPDWHYRIRRDGGQCKHQAAQAMAPVSSSSTATGQGRRVWMNVLRG